MVAVVRITGWNYGLQKVSMTKRIRERTDLVHAAGGEQNPVVDHDIGIVEDEAHLASRGGAKPGGCKLKTGDRLEAEDGPATLHQPGMFHGGGSELP